MQLHGVFYNLDAESNLQLQISPWTLKLFTDDGNGNQVADQGLLLPYYILFTTDRLQFISNSAWTSCGIGFLDIHADLGIWISEILLLLLILEILILDIHDFNYGYPELEFCISEIPPLDI